MRVIALDVGERRVGVATSDPTGKTAQPVETIERNEEILKRLGELVEELGAERVVVGLPLRMDGSEGHQAALVREFADEVSGYLDIPVTFLDERLTTRQASAVLAEGGARKRDRKGAADRIAAALILSQYLETLSED